MAEWQKGTGWKEWFEITGADGVDFHPIGQDPRKTQLLCCNLIPRKIFQKEKSAIQRVVIHSGKKSMAKNIISLLTIQLR